MKGKKFGDNVQCSTSIKRLLRFYIIVATWDFPWISAMSNKGKMQSCAVVSFKRKDIDQKIQVIGVQIYSILPKI